MTTSDPLPDFLYGTAWKEDRSAECVFLALKAGFRAIDTANQRKHYFEEGVGEGFKRAANELSLKRSDLFLQTKFTFARGQDHRLPYEENAPYETQVLQSFASSLKHLSTDYLDSYVLHGPMTSDGLTDADWETWEAMETLHKKGTVRHLGVSNVELEQLQQLFEHSKIKPSFVQNRCFANQRWDKEIREYCLQNGVKYQGFSLLTANWKFLGGKPGGLSSAVSQQLQSIIDQSGKSIEQIVFRFSQQVGMLPITGTTSFEHMRSDLEILDFELTPAQMEILENVGV